LHKFLIVDTTHDVTSDGDDDLLCNDLLKWIILQYLWCSFCCMLRAGTIRLRKSLQKLVMTLNKQQQKNM